MSDRLDDIFEPENDVLFADEGTGNAGPDYVGNEPWKIVIADDDEEVHALTRLVLADFSFEGKGLEFHSAYSGKDTAVVLRDHPDTALLLLDVVMEKDDAGLETVKIVREELGNHFVRIILRTGQPGQTPEQDVVSAYDINDYKAKTELTAQKLSTTVTAALRSYRDIRTIDRQRQNLEAVNGLCRDLYQVRTPDLLGIAALDGLATLLRAHDPGRVVDAMYTHRESNHCIIAAGIGYYEGTEGRIAADILEASLKRRVDESLAVSDEGIGEDGIYAALRSECGREGRVILHSETGLDPTELEMAGVYLANVRTAFTNIHLNREIWETQREMILTLGEVVESRSKETANHVRRVGRMSRRLAELLGIDDEAARMLEMAAPLHDVGKIGIPDEVLLKPGRLTDEERAVMQRHAEIGHDILLSSKRELFKTAAITSHQHHEKWDGSGYPRGLAGEDIHIYGRIVAIVDVFDALAHARVYKDAMPLEKCLMILRKEAGRHFDPEIVKLFLDNIDEFTQILEELKDEDVVAPAPEIEILSI